MQFALFNLMSLNHPGETPAGVLGATVRRVREAEDLGFDAAWFAEHHFSSASVCPSPILMATHCAAVTRRIALGPAVVVLPLHHPLRVAQEVAMLDLLSGGRAMLGVGTGHQPHEFRSFGVPMAARGDIAEEAWDILDMALATGRVEYVGRHFRVPETVLAVRPGAVPPMFMAGGDPRFLRRAAGSGVVPFISQGYKPLAAAMKLRAGVEAAFRAAGWSGADVPLAVQRYVFVTDDAAEARAAAEALLAFARRTLLLRDEFPARDGVHLRSVPFAKEPDVAWLLRHALIGDAESIAERLAGELGALRPRQVSFYMGFTGLPEAAVARSLAQFGERVLPVLRDAAAGLGATPALARAG